MKKFVVSMTSIFTVAYLVLTPQFAFSSDFDAKIEVGSAQISLPDNNNVQVPIMVQINEHGQTFIMRQLPEGDRYFKYGPWKTDLNLPIEVLLDHLAVGVFSYNNEIFVVGRPRPYERHNGGNAPAQLVTPKKFTLYKLRIESKATPPPSFANSATVSVASSALFLGFSYLLMIGDSSMGLQWVAALLGVASLKDLTPLPLSGSQSMNIDRMVPRHSKMPQNFVPSVRKIDESKPWSANNIEVYSAQKSSGNITVKFASAVRSLDCRDLLTFRPNHDMERVAPNGQVDRFYE